MLGSNLHPVFQQALAPFVLKNKDGTPVSAALAAQFEKTYPIAPRKSTQTFEYRLCGVDLECELEWEKEEPRTWNDPGCPAEAFVVSAMCGDQDISELLSDEQREEIETAFLNQEPEEA